MGATESEIFWTAAGVLALIRIQLFYVAYRFGTLAAKIDAIGDEFVRLSNRVDAILRAHL
jgi:hypothetical protein